MKKTTVILLIFGIGCAILAASYWMKNDISQIQLKVRHQLPVPIEQIQTPKWLSSEKEQKEQKDVLIGSKPLVVVTESSGTQIEKLREKNNIDYLYVGADRNTWKKILELSQRGDAAASLQIARTAKPLAKIWPEGSAPNILGTESADKFYWLKLAAAQGSVEAKNLFANSFYSLKFTDSAALSELNQNQIFELRTSATAYLNEALASSYADSFLLASRVLISNEDGIPFDQVESLLCLKWLESSLGTDATSISKLVAHRSAPLRAAEVAELNRRWQMKTPCKV